MRFARGGWLVGLAAVAVAAPACEQTLHLYQTGPDAGSKAGAGGPGGTGGNGGRGGKFGSGGGSWTDAGPCLGPTPQQLYFTPDAPQVVVVLDRSTQMYQPFSASDTEVPLNVALNALYTEVGAYSASSNPDPRSQKHPAIAFSFLDFPDSDPGCSAPAGCCTTDVVRTSSPSSFMSVAFKCETPSSSCLASDRRPTAAALGKAHGFLANSGTSNPRYVLLITDGPPVGQCASPGFNDCTDAVSKMQGLADDGISALIIGAGAQNSLGCLPDLTVAAGGTDWPYYPAPSSNELTTAIFNALAATVCHVTLTWPPPSSANLSVALGQSAVQNDHNNGWTYDATSGRLHLHGTSCQAYTQYGWGALQVLDACDPGHPGSGSPPP
jgi:hypothetical protein